MRFLLRKNKQAKTRRFHKVKAKKGLKKVLAWGMSIVCMLAKASASTSWNFKNTGFKNLGTISSTVTVDNLSLIATSSKTMSVIANSQTVDGTAYTYALALGGSGSTSYRAVKVPVSGTDTIKVVPAVRQEHSLWQTVLEISLAR